MSIVFIFAQIKAINIGRWLLYVANFQSILIQSYFAKYRSMNSIVSIPHSVSSSFESYLRSRNLCNFHAAISIFNSCINPTITSSIFANIINEHNLSKRVFPSFHALSSPNPTKVRYVQAISLRDIQSMMILKLRIKSINLPLQPTTEQYRPYVHCLFHYLNDAQII